jgi:hypothetical protein
MSKTVMKAILENILQNHITVIGRPTHVLNRTLAIIIYSTIKTLHIGLEGLILSAL